MIYLLGVDHQVQHQKNTQISMVFAFYLSKKVKELNIKFVGEEWSKDSSKISNVKTTITQEVAKKHKIMHSFCDPDETERKQISWLSKKDDLLREKFWLDKIKKKAGENIIFVCGADHLGSFSKLVSDFGYQVQILPKRFDVDTYLRSNNKDL